MARSIPEQWVERLFSRMASIWGSRFLDKWRDTDLAEVKATWRLGMTGLSDEALRRGVSALFHEKDPPDLPRFKELCSPPMLYRAPSLVDDMQRTPPDEARAQLERISAMVTSMFRDQQAKRHGSIEWAFRLLHRAECGEAITAIQAGFAKESIRVWCDAHGVPVVKTFEELQALGAAGASCNHAHDVQLPTRVPSPHIYGDNEAYREPGMDDEPFEQGART